MRGRSAVVIGFGLLTALLATPDAVLAQRNPPRSVDAQAEGQGRTGGARPGRAGLPPAVRNMDAQQLQQHIDALALVQAQKEFNLTDEQQPTFAARLTRLQNLRRRQTNQRRNIFQELRPLLEAQPPKDEAISEKLAALKELNRRSAEEIVKAYEDLDGVLTPWQRARFRLFEERLERTKVDLLAKINAGNRGGN